MNNDKNRNPKYPTISYDADVSGFGRPPAQPKLPVPVAQFSHVPVPPPQPYNVPSRPSARPGTFGQAVVSLGQQSTYVSVPPQRHQPVQAKRPEQLQPLAEFAQDRRGRKRALIVGCNYRGTQYELKGCINDARHVKHMLCNEFNFHSGNIRLLLDDGSGDGLPTRYNIIENMTWLLSGVVEGDSLFFHFSGHGSQVPDLNGDERDGLDETLLPCDFASKGQIVDDDINSLLIRPLPRGAYLHAIIDACHSGTAMDLEFYTKLKKNQFEWRSEGPSRIYKGTSGGIAICFSACTDSQVAQDTDNLAGGIYTGAATHSFIEAVVQNRHQPRTYALVLFHMCKKMEDLTGHPAQKVGMFEKIVGTLKSEMLSALGVPKQTPQISSNAKLNLEEQLHI